MFEWKRLEAIGIYKADKDNIDGLSTDGIHCVECGEHLSEHGIRESEVLHPKDISFAISIAKSENDACASLCNRMMLDGNESYKNGHFHACETIKSEILERNNHGL